MSRHIVRVSVLSLILLLSYTLLLSETLAEPPSNFHDTDAGTIENPYLISTLASLRWLSETPEVWGCEDESFYFRQTADIDATESVDWNGGVGIFSIGYRSFPEPTPFYGHFDGNHFAISNLRRTSLFTGHIRAGVFGYIKNATLKNINMVNVVLRQSYGGLVCYAIDSSIINCSVSGTMSSNADTRGIGGLVGTAYNTYIEFCRVYARILLRTPHGVLLSAGGIVGLLQGSILRNSYFYGEIVTDGASHWYGGLVWQAGLANEPESFPSEISFCYVASRSQFASSGGYGLAWGIDPTFLQNNFWDVETTGVSVPHPGTPDGNNFGLPTSQMKLALTYIDNGWDFETIWSIDPAINDGYPFINLRAPRYFPPVYSFEAEAGDGEVTLTWHRPDMSHLENVALVRYRLYRKDILGGTPFVLPGDDLSKVQSFTDRFVQNGTTYSYYITAVYETEYKQLIASETSPIVEVTPNKVSEIDLVSIASITEIHDIYPNPFNPETTISYTLESAGFVTLEIYNVKGQLVDTLVRGYLSSGSYSTKWDGTDSSGKRVGSGLYLVRLTSLDAHSSKKMILLK
jgi:hypothetical protein